MALNNRYQPSHPAGSAASYYLDWSAIFPPGVGITGGTLIITRNTVPPTPIQPGEWTITGQSVVGRRTYATLSGGTAGTDYRLNWQALDTLGGNWLRTCLLLAAQTS
jgi:hypothetical protein